jgi:hypothetical protein
MRALQQQVQALQAVRHVMGKEMGVWLTGWRSQSMAQGLDSARLAAREAEARLQAVRSIPLAVKCY